MKKITVTVAALLFSALALAQSDLDSSRMAPTETRAHRSGASTVNPNPGMTMNDHDKMLEMCRSMRTTRSCDEIIKDCSGATQRESCMRQYMK